MMRAASRRAEAEAEDPFHIAKGRPDAFDDVPETARPTDTGWRSLFIAGL
jgi:hypothetical protein